MKICFPIGADAGPDSTIYGHFASAPQFLIVDTEENSTCAVANCDGDDPQKRCNPFLALQGRPLDGIVVDGIGDDALRTMQLCGFRVFAADSTVVRENLAPFVAQQLQELEAQDSHLEGNCSDQGGGCTHGCSHGH